VAIESGRGRLRQPGGIAQGGRGGVYGYRTLRGKEAFGGEIENDAAAGSPTLHLERLIEEGDTVVAIGHGEMTLKEAGRVAFVSAEVFTFTGVAGGVSTVALAAPAGAGSR
jgi:hypothetical protein